METQKKPISYWEEIKRKGVHLSSLWMVAATLLLAKYQWISCLLFFALMLLTLFSEHDYANNGKYLGRLYGKLFGKMLRDSLDVPVGLICNAVGGSATESWIDRNTLDIPVFPFVVFLWNPLINLACFIIYLLLLVSAAAECLRLFSLCKTSALVRFSATYILLLLAIKLNTPDSL